MSRGKHKNRHVFMALAAVIALWLLARPDAPAPDIHDAIQQRLLEAEYGSARSFHFAAPPTAPVGNGEPLGEVAAKLRAGDPAQRWAAAGELARRRDRRAVEAIIDAMLDTRDTIRVCVMATALGRIGDPRALSPLTQAAFDPGNCDLRLCAIQSLGMIGDRRAVPDLIRALEERNMPVAAADALARLGDARALAPLLTAAQDPELRLWMVRALGELGQPGAEAALRVWAVPDHPEARVREAAVEALWKLERLASAQPLAALAKVLQNDPDPSHRAWAAFRLGEARDPTGAAALTAALADDVPGVRERAAAALIRIGAPARAAALARSDESGPGQTYAVAVLGYVGQPDDIAHLQTLTKSDHAPLSTVAAHSTALIRKFHAADPGPGLADIH